VGEREKKSTGLVLLMKKFQYWWWTGKGGSWGREALIPSSVDFLRFPVLSNYKLKL
jgi:hypothetical protein